MQSTVPEKFRWEKCLCTCFQSTSLLSLVFFFLVNLKNGTTVFFSCAVTSQYDKCDCVKAPVSSYVVYYFHAQCMCVLQSDRYNSVQDGDGSLYPPVWNQLHQADKHRSSLLQTGRDPRQVCLCDWVSLSQVGRRHYMHINTVQFSPQLLFSLKQILECFFICLYVL